MADSGEVLGKGVIPVSADLSEYDKAMDALPGKARNKIKATMQSMSAEMARTKLDLKSVNMSALMNFDPSKVAFYADEITRLEAVQSGLQVKMAAVSQAAIKQGSAYQQMAATAKEAAAAAKEVVAAKKEVAAAEKEAATAAKMAAKEVVAAERMAAKEATAAAREAAAAHGARIKNPMQSLQAEMARTRLDVKVADNNTANPAQRGADLQRLAGIQEQLRAKMDAVSGAAVRQAAAHQQASAATRQVADAAKQAAAASGRAGAAASQAQGGFRNMGTGVLFVSQAIEDAQYGFSAIVNNIPGIVMAFGGTGGLAGGISIAAVAANVLYNNWGKLTDALGVGHTKSEAEAMAELAKQTEKTAEETLKLAKYEEMRTNAKAQREGKPEAKTEFAEAINKAVVEGPISEIDKGIDKHFGGRIRAMADIDPRSAEASKDLEEKRRARDQTYSITGEGNRARGAADAEVKAAQDRLNAIYAVAREKFMAGLATKPDVAKAVGEAAAKNPNDFGPNGAKFGADLKDALPENIKAAKKDEQDQAAEESMRQTDKFIKQNRAERDAIAAGKDDQVMASEESARQNDKFTKQNRSERAGKEAGNLYSDFVPKLESGLLAKIARGEKMDPKDLAGEIRIKLEAAGYENAGEIARQAAKKATEGVDERVKQRQALTGETKEQAGLAELAKDAQRAKAEADRMKPSYNAMDVLSHHQEMQEGFLKGGGAGDALKDETKRAADNSAALNKTLREATEAMKALKGGIVGRFGGKA